MQQSAARLPDDCLNERNTQTTMMQMATVTSDDVKVKDQL